MSTLKDAQQDKVVFALDIGTTKVCAMAGKRDQYGRFEILGVGKVSSEGVSRGVVSNIDRTVAAISQAVSKAEQMSGYKAAILHVGIAGQHIKSLQHRGILTRDHSQTEIGAQDIQKLIDDMYKLVLPPGDEILHVIPQEFTIDNEQGIIDPVGMSGVRLEANFHIITGQKTALQNIIRCVERCTYATADVTLEPIASAKAILSDEEKEAGVALVDIGGGTTDITIFQDGIIRHTAVIPLGGNVISSDIKEGCRVMDKHAETLKVKFGCAYEGVANPRRIITIPTLKGQDPKEISELNLARIIQARVEEIFFYVNREIQLSGFSSKLIGGIVLTGGGALLRHIDKVVALSTGMNTRIGHPVENLANGYSEEMVSPVYATAIGLLIKGVEDIEEGRISYEEFEKKNQESTAQNTQEKETAQTGSSNWLAKMFESAKDWFEAEPDSEF